MTLMVQATATTRSETSSEVRERVARRIAAPEGRRSAYSPGAGRLEGRCGSAFRAAWRRATGHGAGSWGGPGLPSTPCPVYCLSPVANFLRERMPTIDQLIRRGRRTVVGKEKAP